MYIPHFYHRAASASYLPSMIQTSKLDLCSCSQFPHVPPYGLFPHTCTLGCAPYLAQVGRGLCSLHLLILSLPPLFSLNDISLYHTLGENTCTPLNSNCSVTARQLSQVVEPFLRSLQGWGGGRHIVIQEVGTYLYSHLNTAHWAPGFLRTAPWSLQRLIWWRDQ
jgi:hypothetical protein